MSGTISFLKTAFYDRKVSMLLFLFRGQEAKYSWLFLFVVGSFLGFSLSKAID